MKSVHLAGLALVAGVALAAVGFYAGRQAEISSPTPTTSSAPEARQVLYWHDPMVPGQRFDKPGKSPFMDMQLVPVYAAGEPGTSGVNISAAVQQNLGMRWATVRRADVASSFDAVGSVQFDERLSVSVQTRVAGYVEHLAVRAPMERVRKGQALATIFAPDWLGPQNEWLALQRAGASPELIAAAHDRMRAMSIPAALVQQSEAAGTAVARFTLSAPASGVVAELGVREGVAVAPGTTLFRIAGLGKVWAVAEVPEAQALRLTRGQKVKAVLQADGAQGFEGQLMEILPEVNASTRTLQARFEVDNRNGKLVPGMLLRLQVAGPATSRLVVPSEAVIRTGRRAVVIVRSDSGAFVPRDVSLGMDAGDEVEILQGLREGEQVVASGQFLIDSEAHLRSALGGMAAPPVPAVVPASAPTPAPAQPAMSAAPPTAAPGAVHTGQGKVEDLAADSMTISHAPIASLRWPSMTMGFSRPEPKAFADIKVGDTVRFAFTQGGPMGYTLQSVQKLPAGTKP